MRDRFLLLAGAAACRAGWADLAADCHRTLTTLAPQHLSGRFETVADGLRDEEFAKLVHHWEKFCPLERAEMLLSELGEEARETVSDTEQAAELQRQLRATFTEVLH